MPARLHRIALWLSLVLTCLALSGPGTRAVASPRLAQVVLVEQRRAVDAPEHRQRAAIIVSGGRAPAHPPALESLDTTAITSSAHRLYLQHCALLR